MTMDSIVSLNMWITFFCLSTKKKVLHTFFTTQNNYVQYLKEKKKYD